LCGKGLRRLEEQGVANLFERGQLEALQKLKMCFIQQILHMPKKRLHRSVIPTVPFTRYRLFDANSPNLKTWICIVHPLIRM
jgi:hypothetical protein